MSGAQPRSLMGPGEAGAWRVSGGHVDLFLIAVNAAGEPQAERFPVARIPSGEWLFPVAGEHAAQGLFAVCSSQATLRWEGHAPAEPALRERWLARLGGSLEAVVARRREEEDSGWQRSERSAALESATFQRSLRTLVETFQPDSRSSRAALPSGGNELEALCQVLHRSTGLPFRCSRQEAASPFAQVRNIARASGLRYRRVTLKGTWWQEQSGPLLATLAEGEKLAALVQREWRSGYVLLDPATGREVVIDEESAGRLQGVAYMFYRPFPPRRLTFVDLLQFLMHGASRDLATIGVITLLGSVLGIALPVATGLLYDSVIPSSDRSQLFVILAFLACAKLTSLALSLTNTLALLRLEGRMDAMVQAAVWDRLLSLPTSFFRDYSAGDLADRSLAIDQIRRLLSTNLVRSALEGVWALTGFAVIFLYSPAIGVYALAIVALIILAEILLAGWRLRLQKVLNDLSGKTGGLVYSLLHGIAKIRASAAERRAFIQWARLLGAGRRLSVRQGDLATASHLFETFIRFAAMAGIFWLAANEPPGTLTTGAFLAILSSFGSALNGMLLITGIVFESLEVVSLYERVKPILETEPETRPDLAEPGRLTGAIELNQVVFRYAPNTAPVLNRISLSIEPGECVAFVGETGCGKSTMLRLLLGFEKPEAGAVYYDGKDLAGLDPEAVRSQMGVVLQNGSLLAGDILTNIIGSTPLQIDDAWEAARIAGIQKDIQALPMGMYTMVQEGGGGFSGGQRQRLLIARAVVGQPKILIFDEATSALDNRTQALVSEALDQLPVTRIIVAHRLSTIRQAHRIFVLDQGQVAECGTYDELLAGNGLFRKLAERQLMEEGAKE